MKIAIIGAGFTGLTAALDLAEGGHSVVVYEKNAYAGGLAAGFKAPGWKTSVEFFYHHWFESDAAMKRLLRRLEIEDLALFYTPKSVMYHNGKFYPFDSIPAALAYPGLGYGFNKIRFGLVGVYLRLTKNWSALEKVTAKEWMMKWAGDFVYRTMWEPMMIGKFGEDYADRVNMAWLWARIAARTTSLGTFKGGFQAMINTFVEKLKSRGVEFRFGTDVRRVEPDETGRLSVVTDQDGVETAETYDRVLATCAPHAFEKLVPALGERDLAPIRELKSIGAVVLVLALRHPLSPEGYYWYNLPKAEGFLCLALVEHTNFVPNDEFDGQTIVYAGDYLEPSHENFTLSKDELVKKIIPGLKKINPDFDESWVIDAWKFQTMYAQPIPFVNHSNHLPPMKTSTPGLYFASMSHVYPYDRGTNYAIELGEKAAAIMIHASES